MLCSEIYDIVFTARYAFVASNSHHCHSTEMRIPHVFA